MPAVPPRLIARGETPQSLALCLITACCHRYTKCSRGTRLSTLSSTEGTRLLAGTLPRRFLHSSLVICTAVGRLEGGRRRLGVRQAEAAPLTSCRCHERRLQWGQFKWDKGGAEEMGAVCVPLGLEVTLWQFAAVLCGKPVTGLGPPGKSAVISIFGNWSS